MPATQKILLVLGGTLLVLGLGLGFLRTVYAPDGMDCGSAFHERVPQAGEFSDRPTGPWPACQSPLSDARVAPVVLIGLGLGAAGSSLVLRRPSEA